MGGNLQGSFAPCLLSPLSWFPEFLTSRAYISVVGNQLPLEVLTAARCLPANTDAFSFSFVYIWKSKRDMDHLINYERQWDIAQAVNSLTRVENLPKSHYYDFPSQCTTHLTDRLWSAAFSPSAQLFYRRLTQRLCLSSGRLVSRWLLPRALSRYIGPEIWVAGWPQTEGMFCLDVHSRATSLMWTEQRGREPTGLWNTPQWKVSNRRVNMGVLCGTTLKENGHNWKCCISGSKPFITLVFASLHPFTQGPSHLCCQETQGMQSFVYTDQLWIFNSNRKQGQILWWLLIFYVLGTYQRAL